MSVLVSIFSPSVFCFRVQAPGPKWPCAGGKNSISSGASRLVECTAGGCRFEIKHNDEWGTVCSQQWKDVNAIVACR